MPGWRPVKAPYCCRPYCTSITLTGFKNLGHTCFANVVLQTFMHVEALRDWIRSPLAYEQDILHDAQREAQLRALQTALGTVLRWHSTGQWHRIAPIELLHRLFVFSSDTYGMLAGRQCDALDCFKIFHLALGDPSDAQCFLLDQTLQLSLIHI